MTLTLGVAPVALSVVVALGADWTVDLAATTADGAAYTWPVGTTARLVLGSNGPTGEIVWPATVTGNVLRWFVPATQVDEVPSGSRARLYLDDPTDAAGPYLWASGTLSRVG